MKYSLAYFLIYGIVVSTALIFFPVLLIHHGYSPLDVGLVLSCYFIAPTALPFVFLKTEPSNKIIYITLLVNILASIAFIFTIDSIALLMLNILVFGFSFSLLGSVLDNIVLSSDKERYGAHRGAGSVGFLIFSLLLGSFGSEQIIYSLVVFNSLALFAIFHSVMKKDTSSNAVVNTLSTAVKHLLNFSRIWMFLLMYAISMGVFYAFFSIYLINKGFSISFVSFLWAFSTFVEIVFFYFQKHIVKTSLIYPLLLLGLSLSVVRFLILAYFPTTEFIFFSQFLHLFSFGIINSAMMMFFTTHDPKHLFLNIQMYRAILFGAGSLIGTIAGGFIFPNHFTNTLIALMLLSILFLLLSKKLIKTH